MRISRCICFIIICFNCLLNTSAQENQHGGKIGLALSGGGAKGIAHVAVLKVLEEEGIPIDYITGTSFGSIVGGLYSIGYTTEDLYHLSLSLKWSTYFSDQSSRDQLPVLEKFYDERYLLDFKLEKGQVVFPTGFMVGQRLKMLLGKLTWRVHDIDDFNQFQIPFRCVTTDLETGEAYVISHGDLADAIKASSSIPSALAPIEIDGHLLVDGGLARNLPVQDAFDMGANIVIGVEVGAPLFKKEEIRSMLDVLDQTSSFKKDENNREQLALADVVIRPDISGYGAFSFENPDTLLARGERAARAMVPQIHAMMDSLGIARRCPDRESHGFDKDTVFDVREIDFVGLEKVGRSTLMKISRLELPKRMTMGEIERQVSVWYGTGLFREADFRIHQLEEGVKMVIRFKEDLENSFRVGLNYDSDFSAGVLLNYTSRNILMNGTKLAVDFRLSENPAARLEYIYYSNMFSGVGLRMQGLWNSFPGSFYKDEELVNEVDFQHGMMRLDLFAAFDDRTYLAGGIGMDYIGQTDRFFSTGTQGFEMNSVNLNLSIYHDTFDRLYFPREGRLFRLDGKYLLKGTFMPVGRPDTDLSTNAILTGSFNRAFCLGPKTSLHWFNSVGLTAYRSNEVSGLFYLGRELPYEFNYFKFYGLQFMEQAANNLGISGLRYQWEWNKSWFLSLAGNAGYVKVDPVSASDGNGEVEPTEVNEDVMVAQDDLWLFGAGLEIGTLTPIGPIKLGLENNLQTGNFNVSFQLGFKF